MKHVATTRHKKKRARRQASTHVANRRCDSIRCGSSKCGGISKMISWNVKANVEKKLANQRTGDYNKEQKNVLWTMKK